MMETITKQAAAMVINTMIDLPAGNDEYPCSPRSAILAGCAAIMNNRYDELPGIMKTSGEYQVAGKITEFATKYANHHNKQEAAAYALTTSDGTHYLPIYTKELAKQAEEHFDKHYMKYPYDWRQGIATKIACKLNNKVTSNAIKAYTELENLKCNVKEASTQLADRSVLVRDLDSKRMYIGMAKLAAMAESNNQLLKIAHMVERLDRHNGVYPYLNKTATTPINTIFCNEIPEEDVVIKLSSDIVSLKKLMELPESEYVSILGKDVAEELKTDGKLDAEKVKRIIPTLPRGDKELLNKYTRNKH